MTYLEMGKRQGNREYLAKAEAILVSLGTWQGFQEKN
jgi:hypothetical protein